MSDNFAACLAVTLRYEGGRADDPRDPGGRTNRGITQRTYDSHRRNGGLPGRDVFDISDAEVRDIYRRDYWQPSGAGALPAGLDLSLFDAAVNSGVGQGRRWLAKAEQRAGSGVAEEIRAFAEARLAFLHALRTWASFGRGWAARVAGIEAKALRMALDAAGLAPPAAAALADGGATHAKAALFKHAAAHLGTAVAGTAMASTALAVSGLAGSGLAGAHVVPTSLLAGALSLAGAAALAFGGWRDGLRAAAQTAEVHAAQVPVAQVRAASVHAAAAGTS